MAQRVAVVAVMALMYLGLVTLADVATSSTYLILLTSNPADFPDISTVNIILSEVSNVIGQLVMIRLVGARGSKYAMKVNMFNMLAISIVTLISVKLPSPSCYILAAVIAPLLKCVGGGSHASSFLALTMLHHNPNANIRSVYFYLTGAVTTLCQVSGVYLLTYSIGHFEMTASIISIICSILAYCIVTFYRPPGSEPEDQDEDVEPSITDPLLPPQEQAQQDIQQPQGQIASIIRGFHEDTGNAFSTESHNIPYVAAAVFLMAFCRPALAISVFYFYRRIGQFIRAWSILGFGLHALLLPFMVLFLAPRISVFSNSTLYIGQISILIGVLGALDTGLASDFTFAFIGTILNTVGSTARLSILAFAANLIPGRVAGRVYMLIAFVESFGALIGIGISFSIYYGGYGDKPVLAGPALYFTCTAIYLVAAILVWVLKPIPEERDDETN